MLKINIEKISPSLAKVRKTPSKTLARTHYINFLKKENKFIDATERYECSAENMSLKAIPQFFNAVRYFILMSCEKFKSYYYFQK